MPVVDASVYSAALHAEDTFHDLASAWLGRAMSSERLLIAPTLLLVEVAGAITRVAGSARTGRRALSDLLETRELDLQPLSRDRGLRAAEIALKCSLRGADAVYLALAEETGEPLVTFDREQAERGAAVATIEWPDDVG